MPTSFERARQKYKPDPGKLEYLLIAEAPPPEEGGRFFYFETVPTNDSLFLETMKVLYPERYTNTPYVRENKETFLNQFMNDGFYLIDSMDSPVVEGVNRVGQIRASLPSLKSKINQLADENTKMILISKSVFDACFDELNAEHYNVINKEMIDFPGSGGQKKFREKMSRLLEQVKK